MSVVDDGATACISVHRGAAAGPAEDVQRAAVPDRGVKDTSACSADVALVENLMIVDEAAGLNIKQSAVKGDGAAVRAAGGNDYSAAADNRCIGDFAPGGNDDYAGIRNIWLN